MENTFELSGTIVDVISGTLFPGIIRVTDGVIVSCERTNSAGEGYIVPGLVDAHVHIESSMLIPSEFARLAVVHGTVGTVSDPHEIANVLGIDGVKFMIQNAAKTPFHICFGAPSCVPATIFESSGANLGTDEVAQLLRMSEVGYLAEMMNFPGVLYHDPLVYEKLAAARRFGKPVDGHAPGLTGEDARKYVEAGISTDHECYTLDEALDKIGFGMKVLIREGSAARNFDTLLPLLKLHPDKVMFCSDDKHPDDLVNGHINLLVKRALAAGFDPITVLRACTLNPVQHYNLKTGLLQPGDAANFIRVDNLNDFNVLETYLSGRKVAESGRTLLKSFVEQPLNRFEADSVTEEQLKVPVEDGLLNVIEAYNGELITGWIKLEPSVQHGEVVSDTTHDVLKLVVINRFEKSEPSIGFIKGFGLKKGAMASTVAHDSHNVICVGASDADMVTAINKLVESRGGICVADGRESHILPLPVAGLMSADDGYRVAELYESINRRATSLGGDLEAPFMTLSFMALLVIPALKISDKGLFDGRKFEFTGLFE